MSIGNENQDISIKNIQFLKAVDIIPKDDTFHGNINLLDIEWWYFDAVFDNGYSLQIGFRIYHVRNMGIVQTRINIYKDGKTILEKLKVSHLSHFNIDEEYPNIKIKNKKVVEFNEQKYHENKKWEYKINLTIKDIDVDLLFYGTTKGWKIETPTTCWTVPIPKGLVEGRIKIKKEEIPVKGIGYHDHNWSYSPVTAMNNLGWYWARISSETMNLTWAKVIHSEDNIDLLAVLNQDGGDYYNIDPKYIEFNTKDYQVVNKGKIPKTFELKIKDESNKDKISCNVKMDTYELHYNRIFTIKYWRYHIKTNGFFEINNLKENLVDKSQIIEYLKFKSKNFY